MKKWTDEIDRFILDRLPCKESCDKTMLLLAINERFGTHFTRYAFTTHLVDKGYKCGIKPWNERENKNKPNFNQQPLYSERKKKGMVQIKVAEPNIWKQKNVWVYEQTNNCEVPKGCKVIFLNSNKEDFSPDNLYMVTQAELGIINRWYRGFSTDKEESMNRILNVKIAIQRHKRAREIGEENSSGFIRSDIMEYYKRKMQDPVYAQEYRRKRNIRRLKKRIAEGKPVFEGTRRKYGV